MSLVKPNFSGLNYWQVFLQVHHAFYTFLCLMIWSLHWLGWARSSEMKLFQKSSAGALQCVRIFGRRIKAIREKMPPKLFEISSNDLIMKCWTNEILNEWFPICQFVYDMLYLCSSLIFEPKCLCMDSGFQE